MDKIRKKVLINLNDYLTEHMNLIEINATLFSTDVLTSDEMERLVYERNNQCQNEIFLQILKQKDNNAFDEFVMAVASCEQKFISEKLQKEEKQCLGKTFIFYHCFEPERNRYRMMLSCPVVIFSHWALCMYNE